LARAVLRGQGRIGNAGEDQSIAFLALRPRRQLRFRIDCDHLDVGSKTRRGRPFERKI
jgi:hypothetical protein